MVRYIEGYQSLRTIRLAGGARIVLQSWAAVDDDRFENIVRFEGDNTISWRARLPTHSGRDCFVELDEHDNVLVARTFTGETVRLDPETGQPVEIPAPA